jgi:hypothetical protein
MQNPIWLLPAALLAFNAAGTTTNHQCNVTVQDKSGALVAGAHVHVYRDKLFENAYEQTLVASGAGTVSFPVVDGPYDVCVMGGAFLPQCREVEVTGKDVSVTFTLTVSRAMESRIGDKVY